MSTRYWLYGFTVLCTVAVGVFGYFLRRESRKERSDRDQRVILCYGLLTSIFAAIAFGILSMSAFDAASQ